MPDGVGEDNTMPLRLRLGWDITPQIGLHLYDPAPYIGARFVGGF